MGVFRAECVCNFILLCFYRHRNIFDENGYCDRIWGDPRDSMTSIFSSGFRFASAAASQRWLKTNYTVGKTLDNYCR